MFWRRGWGNDDIEQNAMSDDARSTPVGFYHYAHAYAASALALTSAHVASTHPDAPIRFLYSHAVELYLKSYLLLNGVSLKLLGSHDFGHNVARLLDHAEQLGLAAQDVHRAYAQFLNEAISDRYIQTGSRRVLSNENLFEFCVYLHDQIGPLIYADSNLTRSPMRLK